MADACCKVGAAIDAYDLPVPEGAADLDEYLAARWTGTAGHQPVGYRTLADWFNERLLRTVYLAHDRSATETRIEGEYAALTGDDDFRREEVERDLEADGIDAGALGGALVSRSTMARHLRDCLGAEKPASPPRAGRDWEREKVEYSRRVFREGVAEAVTSLSNKGTLPGGDRATVELPVLLSCPECATRVRLRTALERGYVCAEHLGTRDGD